MELGICSGSWQERGSASSAVLCAAEHDAAGRVALSGSQAHEPFCIGARGVPGCALPGTKVTLSTDFPWSAFMGRSSASEFAFLAAPSNAPCSAAPVK